MDADTVEFIRGKESVQVMFQPWIQRLLGTRTHQNRWKACGHELAAPPGLPAYGSQLRVKSRLLAATGDACSGLQEGCQF